MPNRVAAEYRAKIRNFLRRPKLNASYNVLGKTYSQRFA